MLDARRSASVGFAHCSQLGALVSCTDPPFLEWKRTRAHQTGVINWRDRVRQRQSERSAMWSRVGAATGQIDVPDGFGHTSSTSSTVTGDTSTWEKARVLAERLWEKDTLEVRGEEIHGNN